MPHIDKTILKSLIEERSDFVSGSQLAGELGISRVGIWARLEKLRARGFAFEAVRHRGYRLVEEPSGPHDRLLESYLELWGIDMPVYCHERIDSTNSEAQRLLAAGTGTPFVVVAAAQDSGRGRLGRSWYSPSEGNLYASVAFRPGLPPGRMQLITLWLGLSLCAGLRGEFGLNVGIKWPNDLVINGRKLAGILTEARVDSDLMRDLTFGVGLNINGDPSQWPAEVSGIATSLRRELREAVPFNKCAACVLASIHTAYRDFTAGRHEERFADLWKQADVLLGKQVEARSKHQSIAGTASGIDDSGALLIKTDSGNTVAVRAGDVSLGTNPVSA